MDSDAVESAVMDTDSQQPKPPKSGRGLGGGGRVNAHLKFSAALRVVFYFFHNNEDELFTKDIAVKFNIPVRDVSKRLGSARSSGLLHAEPREGKKLHGPGQGLVWRAGPRIKNMIERNTW